MEDNEMSADEELSEAKLEQMQRLCDGATGGPWKAYWEGRDHWGGSNFIQTAGTDGIELIGASMADCDFIASARTDVPRLVEEIRRLRRLLAAGAAARPGKD